MLVIGLFIFSVLSGMLGPGSTVDSLTLKRMFAVLIVVVTLYKLSSVFWRS